MKRSVYVLVDGEPAPREVSTGITDGRLTEITGGDLKEGESVIVSSGSQAQQRGQGQRGGGFRIL
jgi:HlyD family secretion protein